MHIHALFAQVRFSSSKIIYNKSIVGILQAENCIEFAHPCATDL